MRRHIWLVAVSIVTVGAAGTAAVLAAGPATARPAFGNKFTLYAHQTNFEVGYAKNLPNAQKFMFAPGDTFVVREDLRNGGSGGAVVGFDNVQCTATFNDNVACSVVNVLPGKGSLTEVGLAHFGAKGPEPFDAVVTGGTGIFANKRGIDHVVVINDTDSSSTYRLVG